MTIMNHHETCGVCHRDGPCEHQVMGVATLFPRPPEDAHPCCAKEIAELRASLASARSEVARLTTERDEAAGERDRFREVSFRGAGQFSPHGLDKALRDSVPAFWRDLVRDLLNGHASIGDHSVCDESCPVRRANACLAASPGDGATTGTGGDHGG